MKLRFAQPSDSADLLRIYAQYIGTPVTFEYTLPGVDEFANRIRNIGRDYPYIICMEGDNIIGYAYAHRAMEREAYQWNAELSIYLDQEHTAHGLGKQLCRLLIDILRLQGIRNVYSLVTLPNTASERLHASLGFERLGTLTNTGYKNGNWHDVAWFGKTITSYITQPVPFLPLQHIPAATLQNLLQKYSTMP